MAPRIGSQAPRTAQLTCVHFFLLLSEALCFHRIRHYGLFAKGSCAENTARARELLAVSKPEGQPTAAAVDPSKPTCPCCGGRMIIIEVFERGATPRHQPTAPSIVIRIDTS